MFHDEFICFFNLVCLFTSIYLRDHPHARGSNTPHDWELSLFILGKIITPLDDIACLSGNNHLTSILLFDLPSFLQLFDLPILLTSILLFSFLTQLS